MLEVSCFNEPVGLSCHKERRCLVARPHHTSDKIPLQTLEPLSTACPTCGHAAHVSYYTQRTITTLTGRYRLHLVVRRCASPACPRSHQPYRPEAEGAWALPHKTASLLHLEREKRQKRLFERDISLEIASFCPRRGLPRGSLQGVSAGYSNVQVPTVLKPL